MKNVGAGILLLIPIFAHTQESLTIRETSKGNFIATLVSGNEMSIQDAQSRILVAATNTCKDLSPELGHYEFESIKPVSAPRRTHQQFNFKQDFTCQKPATPGSGETHPTLISASEKQQLIELVTTETRKILSSSDAKTFEEFHKKFSPAFSSMLPLEKWSSEQLTLHNNSGAIKSAPLLKVTTYIDPPDSPGPGVYVAVDFQASYDSAPYRCGYFMWLFDQQSNLSVMRLEDGIIYSKDASAMTSTALEQTKQQFRCFAP